jgi:HAD superfamily hydrolase (TIGR01509 family)
MKPKAVVFDLGKVLVDFDYSIAARRLGVAPDALSFNMPLLIEFELGRMDTAAFHTKLSREIGFTGSLDQFVTAFADVFTVIPEMVTLHTELRRRGVPLFLFSNTNEIAVEHVQRHFPFYQEFDAHILSYEHGAMKPEPPLYAVVERLSGKQGAELLYIDDRPENIATGRERGWQAICHQDVAETTAAVRATGLLD